MRTGRLPEACEEDAGASPAHSCKAGLWRFAGADRLHACGAAECEAALYAVGRDVLVLAVSVIIGIVYAARRRTLLRKQLGIAGALRAIVCLRLEAMGSI